MKQSNIATFLSCDWGTSSFRLKLVDKTSGKTLAKIANSEGIRKVFDQWQAQSQQHRIPFFQRKIQGFIDELAQTHNMTLKNQTLVLSGMASSSLGIKELAYAETPFSLNGKDLVTDFMPKNGHCQHDTLLISGVRKNGDVMRGEELQAMGWRMMKTDMPKKCLLILPGTHCKHVGIKGDKIIDFNTYMTGELFDLIQHHSLLKNDFTIENEGTEREKQAFTEGVLAGSKGNLTHILFTIRARILEKNLLQNEAVYFLNGLLLGQEFLQLPDCPIVMCAAAKFHSFYQLALENLNVQVPITALTLDEVENLVVLGHLAVINS